MRSQAIEMSYFLSVRTKTTFASLLAVLLLMLSFTTSMCTAECSFQQFGSPCHKATSSQAEDRHADSGQKMAAMQGMALLNANEHAGHETFCVLVAESCRHHLCAPEAALVGANGTATQLIADQQAVAVLAFVLPVQTGWIVIPSEAPPLRAASPITLQTLLRV